MRFALLCAAVVTAGLFSSPQVYAVPAFGDGWVDQGGKWHAFPHHDENNGNGGQPGASPGAGDGQQHDGNNGRGGQPGAPEGAGDGGNGTTPGDAPHDAGNFATNGNSQEGADNGNSGGPGSNGDVDPPSGGGGSSETDLAGLNIIFNDTPLDNGPPQGTGGGSKGDENRGNDDQHGNSGGTPHDDAGGSSTNPGGTRIAVPEPASILILASGILGAGATRRRRRTK